MFHRRLQWFVVLLSILALIVVGRLVDVQVVSAGQYEALADRLLTRPVRYLRAPRGDILDRQGRPLVSDEPASDISINYRALSGRSDYLFFLARHLRERGRFPRTEPTREIVDELKLRISHTWRRLSDMTGVPLGELGARAEAIVQRVQRIREAQNERSGMLQPVKEENAFHPLIEAVNEDVAMAVRMEFDDIDYPWLAVVPGSRRVAQNVDALVHVLGRLGAADKARIAADPLRDDELLGLRPGDLCGVSGVEFAGERVLRGRRGTIVEDFEHQEIEHSDPVPGDGVTLTIDAEVQARVLEILAARVKESENPAGGSAVVIDAATREILALVSYPVYSYERYAQDYDKLAHDTRWDPLRFRAVANTYPPGSTGKVVTLVGALSDGVITPQTRFHCAPGHFLPNQPEKFRCWIFNQHHQTHDGDYPEGLNAVDAVKNSCNMFFFNTGQRLGPARLCEWFERFGLGRTQGTGLVEEASAIVPTEDFLRRRGRTYDPSDVWNFAIGQGEVTVTPLQAANVAATVVTGRFAPVKLYRTPNVTPLFDEPALHTEFNEAALRVMRSGMYAVTNETGGTAYKYAHLSVNGHVLCGKTGSAQAVPRVLNRNFTYAWPDGTKETYRAITIDEAHAQLIAAHPELRGNDAGIDDSKSTEAPAVHTASKRPRLAGSHAADRYPPIGPDEKLPSHAWFIGFTQSADTPRGERPRGRVYAISVVIEYGGSGGHVASPVAKEIAEFLLGREESRSVGMAVR